MSAAGVVPTWLFRSASAASSATRAHAARDLYSVAIASATAAHLPLHDAEVSFACDTLDERRLHSDSPLQIMSTPATSPPATSIARHSVAYRSRRVVGASIRSARDLKPSSCASSCAERDPSHTETTSACCRDT